MTNNADQFDDLAVRCHGITKTYGSGTARVSALRGVDLEIRRGELLMILGPSGCGKTTLLSIISAMLDQDEGACEVLGMDLRRMKPAERVRFRRESLGLVFQLFNLLPALSAMENVAVPLLIDGVPRRRALDRAREMLRLVDLGGRANALPGELSGGQQQRVAIARARVKDPELILCDEPTSNLDHAAGREMMAILRDVLRQDGRTLIVVTHDTRILEFSDRVARMDDGRIVHSGRSDVAGVPS